MPKQLIDDAFRKDLARQLRKHKDDPAEILKMIEALDPDPSAVIANPAWEVHAFQNGRVAVETATGHVFTEWNNPGGIRGSAWE